jgi:hypothetical protein
MKKFLAIIILSLICSTMLPAPGFAPLDIDSRAWLSLPAPDQAQIDIRVMELKRTLEKMISIDCYKPDGKYTYCNIAAWDAIDCRQGNWHGYGYMLDDLPLDVSMLFPTAGSIMMCSPSEGYRRAMFAEQRGRLESVTMYRAWELAKIGEVVLIISARYNHVCICYPDSRPYIKERGVRVANVGKFNVITDISHRYIFGKSYLNPEIKFYHIKRILTND